MLSQKMFDLPHGFQISIPIAEYYSTRIGKIEGVGIQPHIAIAQSVSMNVAISLINGESQEDALAKAKLEMDKKEKEAFDGETIYLFGTMNDWGKKRNITPRFEFKGNGMYEASATLKKGSYEFKIAPMNWSFDYGANPNEENVPIGKKCSLARVSGSSNLIINLEVESNLTFLLNVSDEMTAVLSVSVE